MINHIHEKHWVGFIHIPPYLECRGNYRLPGQEVEILKGNLEERWATLKDPEDGHTMTLPVIEDE